MKPFPRYYGGKEASGVYQKIINCIRPHKTFISLFLGNDAIVRYKKPAQTTIGLDLHKLVITNWEKINFPGMSLINESAMTFLKNYRIKPGTVIYADPPYPRSSRKSRRKIYKYEMSDQDHIDFLTLVRTRQKECDFLISTYENEIYKEMLKDWNCKSFTARTRKGNATELLYMNYDNTEGYLHDYSFLGEDFKERQRIKRKIDRWVDKLKCLPPSEMRAIIEAIDKID